MSKSEDMHRSTRLFDRAFKLQQSRDYQASIEEYRKLIDEFPNYTLAHFNLGAALQSIGEDELAFYAFQKAAQIDPHFVKAHLNIGVLLEKQGRFDDAISVYRQALEIDSGNGSLHANLCNALIKLERPAEAAQAGELAVRHSPELARAHNNLGLAYLNLRKFESAEECFLGATNLDPQMKLAMANMAVALERQNRYFESRDWFERVLSSYPDYTRARVNYSWLLICLGLWEKSIEMSISAMEIMADESAPIRLSQAPPRPSILESKDCLEALRRFRDILANHRIDTFLVYGTLLGCVRDNDFISYDTDIDVGIWFDEPITQLIDELEENQFELRLRSNRNENKPIKEVLTNAINLPFYYKGRLPIDVYRHFPKKDKTLSGFELGGHPLMYEVSNFQLAEKDFLGEKFLAPIDYEKYLTECYSDWRTPDLLFETTVSSPNLLGGFPEHARALACHRAASRMLERKFEKSFYILSAIAQKDEALKHRIATTREKLDARVTASQ